MLATFESAVAMGLYVQFMIRIKGASDVCCWAREILQKVGVRRLTKASGRQSVASVRRDDCVHSLHLQFNGFELSASFDVKGRPCPDVIRGIDAKHRAGMAALGVSLPFLGNAPVPVKAVIFSGHSKKHARFRCHKKQERLLRLPVPRERCLQARQSLFWS